METKAAPWFAAIGASGPEGLDDISQLLAALPSSLAVVVLVVLHRSWDRLSHLRDVLADTSPFPVRIAQQGERFQVGTVYIGEPSEHLTLAGGSTGVLIEDPHRDYGNRTVDLLFRSVAAHGRGRIIGVVLSGSLDDGSRGLAAIRDAGGFTMVLTPNLLPRRGMPENAIAYDDSVDLIGTPRQIADAICRIVQAG